MQTHKAESMSNETLICKEPVLDIHAILTGFKKKKQKTNNWLKMGKNGLFALCVSQKCCRSGMKGRPCEFQAEATVNTSLNNSHFPQLCQSEIPLASDKPALSDLFLQKHLLHPDQAILV